MQGAHGKNRKFDLWAKRIKSTESCGALKKKLIKKILASDETVEKFVQIKLAD